MFRSTRSTLRFAQEKRGPKAPVAHRHVSRMGHPSTAVRQPITRTTKLCTVAPLRRFVARLIIAAPPKVKREPRRVSIAHEVSGLGSTRVVRFSVPKGSGDDGTGTVATGPENAEVQGRFEPLGAAGAVGNGRGGDSGGVGAAISALPAALRGRRAPRAAGQAPGQGLGQAGAGRRDRMDARRVPDRI